ncbi:hypothetical protein [Mucilaginibacter pedocola]|uniref:Uncharacterized protein n=1 Tax=Mucilaginibacter pedocola TaxID=1792845 RepID=A0A1S9PHH2_9SPHI|nr:hypothetical protein [Mucilaginibacter pedocola]OOQ60400.1 hypothetical protein BC343_25625 [Mucilaginibacter pedocola]
MKELVREIEEDAVTANSTRSVVFDPVLTTCIEGGRNEIEQVISNFISNALILGLIFYSAKGYFFGL